MLSRLLLIAVLGATPGLASPSTFPGLQSVLSEAEWKRAGLDRLTPDQIGVIDAALIRYERSRDEQTEARVEERVAAAAAARETKADRPSVWERFGFASNRGEPHWRDTPPLRAKVVSWQGANRFVLDNGQVWEGVSTIPFELLGEEVAIEARPAGNFALSLDGRSTAVHVRRVK